MKNLVFGIIGLSLATYSCGNSYEKSPEDWTLEVCSCASDKGPDAKECADLLKELKTYYDDADYNLHDKATTEIGASCPEVLLSASDWNAD